MDKKKKVPKPLKGYFFLFLFFFFIIGGIITKRVYGHPEFMMLWHLPGAVFLVLSGKNFTYTNRKRFYQRNSPAKD